MAKYESKNEIRKDLLYLATAIILVNSNNEFKEDEVCNKFSDVTGSQYCWGIQ